MSYDSMEMRNVAAHVDGWIDKGLRHALIDVDNTLVKANITELYFMLKRSSFKHQWQWYLWCTYFALLWAPVYLVLDAINRESFQRAFYRRYHAFSTEQIEAAAELLFQHKRKNSLISYTHHLIAYLKQRNVNVVLLSTNIEPMVKRFADYYGVAYNCLPVIKQGQFSSVRLDNLQDFKLRCASGYPASTLLAAADSRHDLPVLRRAAYAIVISNRRPAWLKRIGEACIHIPRKLLTHPTR